MLHEGLLWRDTEPRESATMRICALSEGRVFSLQTFRTQWGRCFSRARRHSASEKRSTGFPRRSISLRCLSFFSPMGTAPVNSLFYRDAPHKAGRRRAIRNKKRQTGTGATCRERESFFF